MKRFIINMFIVMIFLGFLECFAHARDAKPSNNLVAYHNKISNILYVQDDSAAIIVQSQFDPICIYTPLTYEETGDESLQKTYFLPRTRYAHLHSHAMSEQLQHLLDSLGIHLRMQEVVGKNYGLQMIFTMPSDDAYEITKVVDTDKKMVRFDFVKKI